MARKPRHDFFGRGSCNREKIFFEITVCQNFIFDPSVLSGGN